MNFRLKCAIAMAGVLAAATAASAQQQNNPRIGYVYPAGGQQGKSFEVLVGGAQLENVSAAFMTGKGVKLEVVEHIKPPNQGQLGMLRDRADELRKKPNDPDAKKELDDIRRKMITFMNRSISPAIIETVRLKVTLSDDAPVGRRELRLQTPAGLTNPVVFNVGALPEYSRKLRDLAEDPGVPAGRVRTGMVRPGEPKGGPPPMPVNITLPTIVNGQIMPGSADRYRFEAKKGQKIVIAARARELVPYIADAVPGWFQALVTVYDGKGKELASADHFRYNADPVICFEVPGDGEYVLEIRDSIFRGREDFVYRISVGELPYIIGVYPLGVQVGSKAKVQLTGWNLPEGSVLFDAKDKSPGVYEISVGKGAAVSNSVPFAVDSLPECDEAQPNGSIAAAMPIAVPTIINGRIDKPGQWDVYQFEGRSGQEVVAEVAARRLDSPMDSILKITDAGGKQLACNDDWQDNGEGLDTHHADSYLRLKLPASGKYYVHVGDVQQQGGPEVAYRLRVSEPRPDFALRLAPSSVSIRGGGSTPVTVFALRKDGFSGDIRLSLQGAPAGFVLTGGVIPSGDESVRITLNGPSSPLKAPLQLNIEGSAEIGKRQVVRPAVPAEDMMQAFAYKHLVPSQELDVAVTGGGRAGGRGGSIRILTPTPLKITAGKTAKIVVGVPMSTPMGDLQVELSEPPDGLTLQSVKPDGRDTQIVLACDATKIKPGLEGNLIINLFTVRKPPATTAPATASAPATAPARQPPGRGRFPLGALPAIPFEVVAK